MSDETENVDAGSETSGEQAAAEASQETTAAAETTAASTEQSAETTTDAEGAAETTETTSSEISEDASRTGFAETGLRAGDACVCPDGRKGTVHQYDAGLICMPDQDQG